VGDKLNKIWEKPKEILKPILAKHAIKKKVKKYVINHKGAYDPSYFLTITKNEVKTLINSETEPRNVRMSLDFEMERVTRKPGRRYQPPPTSSRKPINSSAQTTRKKHNVS
jgi:hypothetical protein